MTRPRKELVCVEDTPYYHVVSRCVRRTYLCGVDQSTGKSYEHRRQWIVDRIRILSSLFSIEVCSYAVMSNHYHIVLKLCPDEATAWSSAEVIERWTSLFKGTKLIQKRKAGLKLKSAERKITEESISVYRGRLCNLGWFMKCLNEPIARVANKEDNCKGHFWEARYKSQALYSEHALLSCMTYVDLNPIRSGIAITPEKSDHTSIQERIHSRFDFTKSIRMQISLHSLIRLDLPLRPLFKFSGYGIDNDQTGIPFDLNDYLELVDYTGRIVRHDKAGSIPTYLPPILSRLSINRKQWLRNSTKFEKHFHQTFGNQKRLKSNKASQAILEI